MVPLTVLPACRFCYWTGEIRGCVQAGKGEIVDQMGQLLEQAGMRDVLPLPKARVPVVKFVVPDTNTKVRL